MCLLLEYFNFSFSHISLTEVCCLWEKHNAFRHFNQNRLTKKVHKKNHMSISSIQVLFSILFILFASWLMVFSSWRKGTWPISHYGTETDTTLYVGYGHMEKKNLRHNTQRLTDFVQNLFTKLTCHYQGRLIIIKIINQVCHCISLRQNFISKYVISFHPL